MENTKSLEKAKEPLSKKQRVLGLDIVRMLAIFFVFITHAITYKGVLDVNQLSFKWTIYMIVRFLAMSAVPLFLLLTGYLNNKTEISKKYYRGIIPILISYIGISLITIIAKGIYEDTPINWGLSVIQILNFSANSYAWYFEMYIGLFLLIPFLNRMYNAIEKKSEKIILVVSLAFLTFIPQIVKSFKLYDRWLDITPDYWQSIYPITYFFIGKLIRDFKITLKPLYRILMFLVALAIPCTFCYLFSTETQYAWFIFNGFEAITNAFTAISIFLMFYDIDRKIPVIDFIIAQISICSFEMYLFSYMWDEFLYGTCNLNMFIMVGMVAITTYISAKIFIIVRDFILNLFRKEKKNA